jgi:hypothetical protein
MLLIISLMWLYLQNIDKIKQVECPVLVIHVSKPLNLWNHVLISFQMASPIIILE